MRKTQHWSGGRKELAQCMGIITGDGIRYQVLMALLSDPESRKIFATSGEVIGPMVDFIENYDFTDTVSVD